MAVRTLSELGSGIRAGGGAGMLMLSGLFLLPVQSGTLGYGMLSSLPLRVGVFTPQLNLSFSSRTYPELCLLGDSTFSQVDKD